MEVGTTWTRSCTCTCRGDLAWTTWLLSGVTTWTMRVTDTAMIPRSGYFTAFCKKRSVEVVVFSGHVPIALKKNPIGNTTLVRLFSNDSLSPGRCWYTSEWVREYWVVSEYKWVSAWLGCYAAVALAFANTVRKWTRNLHTKSRICVPTKRNRETNDAFQKQTVRAFPSQYSRAFRDRLSHFVWYLLRPRPAFRIRCTHRFHDFAYC